MNAELSAEEELTLGRKIDALLVEQAKLEAALRALHERLDHHEKIRAEELNRIYALADTLLLEVKSLRPKPRVMR